MNKKLKALLGIIVALLVTVFSSTTVYAKPNISVLKNGKGWFDLSYEDQCDTVVAFIQTVLVKELGLKRVPQVSCYIWPGSEKAAYNTMVTYTICVNMSTFMDDLDAQAANETVEYHVVKILAHEARHSYQQEHIRDYSDYSRAILSNYDAFAASGGTIFEEYNTGFIEADADAYAIDFANKYVKGGGVRPGNVTLTAINGKAFDPVFYVNKYPDVKMVLGTDPQVVLNHYNTYGIKEGRMANANDIIK